MQNHTALASKSLGAAVAHLYLAGESGILRVETDECIETNDCSDSGILFDQGNVVCAGYRSLCGLPALMQLDNTKDARFYFQSCERTFNKCCSTGSARPPDTFTILKMIRYTVGKTGLYHPARKKKVLIMAPSSMTTRLTGAVLEDSGYSAYQSSEVDRGIELAHAALPDAILLDDSFDETCTQDVLDELQSTDQGINTPIIGLTDSNPAGYFASRVDEYIVKPFTREQLLDTVGSYLRPATFN